MNPLLDSNFLVKLNNDRNRTIYAHIISLNQYEQPIEQLEGVVTAGSINIDGQSAVRRTCSLTLSAKNLNINDVYWGISTKVKIEIDCIFYGKENIEVCEINVEELNGELIEKIIQSVAARYRQALDSKE